MLRVEIWRNTDLRRCTLTQGCHKCITEDHFLSTFIRSSSTGCMTKLVHMYSVSRYRSEFLSEQPESFHKTVMCYNSSFNSYKICRSARHHILLFALGYKIWHYFSKEDIVYAGNLIQFVAKEWWLQCTKVRAAFMWDVANIHQIFAFEVYNT